MKIREISLSLASPEAILSWSKGEVKNPETLNYRSKKYVKDGLFDERIFGPAQDYRCSCGKYAGYHNRGKICEVCGVRLGEKKQRRHNFGHIKLSEPVVHFLMFKVSPYPLLKVLEMKAQQAKEVIYADCYVVTNVGKSQYLPVNMMVNVHNLELEQIRTLKKVIKNELIPILEKVIENKEDEKDKSLSISIEEHELLKKLFAYIESENDIKEDFFIYFLMEMLRKHLRVKIETGGRAIKSMLKRINVKEKIDLLWTKVKKKKGDLSYYLKQLQVFYKFFYSGNKLSWMVLDYLPVLPADLRPITEIRGGKFSSTAINNCYRSVIVRNRQLKKFKDLGAPEFMINEEIKLLQKSVDTLIDNERQDYPLVNKQNVPIRSLLTQLKGKTGRFRRHLLGKRVDYSARATIIPDPMLEINQCGIPIEIAVILWEPFIINRLFEENEEIKTVRQALQLITRRTKQVLRILKKLVSNHPVFLNRAPTLHRLNIQSFYPVLTNQKTISLHPLVTKSFNADFDGDQMNIFLPLSEESIQEAKEKVMSIHNIYDPKDGRIIVVPTQDMILGIYYLTIEKKPEKVFVFSSIKNVLSAYYCNKIGLHHLFFLDFVAVNKKEEKEKKFILTTVGKLFFNQVFEGKLSFFANNKNDIRNKITETVVFRNNLTPLSYLEKWAVADPLDEESIMNVVDIFSTENNNDEIVTCRMLDKMKKLGFLYVTRSGITIDRASIGALEVEKRSSILDHFERKVEEVEHFYRDGVVTNEERKRSSLRLWINFKDEIQKKVEENINKLSLNPLVMMYKSGARGSLSNFTQLVGTRGLIINPKGQMVDSPITSSFFDGLSAHEFFISAHGARKGMADVALKTSDSGFLTRKLADSLQNVLVTEEKCSDQLGIEVESLIDQSYINPVIVEELGQRIVGRYSAKRIVDGEGKVICEEGDLITTDIAQRVKEDRKNKVSIYSVLSCLSKKGVCQRCYGIDLCTRRPVVLGTPVGIIAAQSIGEPGTQLTMRTFHTGGVAGELDITQGLPKVKSILELHSPDTRFKSLISPLKGRIDFVEKDYDMADIEKEKSVWLESEQKVFVRLREKSVSEEMKKAKEKGDINKFIGIKMRNGERSLIVLTDPNGVVRVEKDQEIREGSKITDGDIDIKEMMKVAGAIETQQYIVKEMQKIYSSQGIRVSDKYMEIVARQMVSKVVVTDIGDSRLIPYEKVDLGRAIQINEKLKLKGKRQIKYKQVVVGINKIPMTSDYSFLSPASFQDVPRVLVDAAISGKVDKLMGMKENVIIGRKIEN